MNASRLTNLLLKLDSLSFRLKEKLSRDEHGLKVVGWGLLILLTEAGLILAALPLSLIISEKSLIESGAGETQIQTYRLRRKISILTVLGAILLWLLKIAVSAVIAVWLAPPAPVHASSAAWSFSNPHDYIYDSSTIQIVDGIAVLKTQETIDQAIQAPSEQPKPSMTPPPAPDFPVQSDDTVATEVQTPGPDSGTSPEPEVIEIQQDSTAGTPAPASVPVPEQQQGDPQPNDQQQVESFLRPRSARAQGNSKKCTATLTAARSQVVPGVAQWTGFEEVVEKNGGEIYYQLSHDDGSSWYSWRGNDWKIANTESQYNTASEIHSHITSFPVQSSRIKFRAFFVGPCTQEIKLLSINIPYTLGAVPSPSIIPSPTIKPSASIPSSPTPTPSSKASTAPSSPSPSVIPVASPVPSSTVSPSPSPSSPIIQSPTPEPSLSPSPASISSPSLTPTPVPSLPPSPVLGPFTLSFWVVPSLLNGGDIIAAESPYFAARISDTKREVLIAVSAVGDTVSDIAVLLPEEGILSQYLVSMVYTNQTVTVYVNGIALAQESRVVPVDFENVVETPPTGVSVSAEALSQDHIILQYLENRNTPPEVAGMSVTTIESKRIRVAYTVSDRQADFVSVYAAQYKVPGMNDFQNMTLIDSEDSEGLTSLSASSEGVEHSIMWDALADLGQYSGPITILLAVRDSLEDGGSVMGDISAVITAPLPDSTPASSPSDAPGPSASISPSPLIPGSSAPGTEESVATSQAVAIGSPVISPAPIAADTTQTFIEQISDFVGTNLPSTTIPLLAVPEDQSENLFVEQSSALRESPLVPIPTITTADLVLGARTVRIRGKSLPNAEIILYVFSNQAVVYRTKAAANGEWEYTHSQDVVLLEPGTHSVYAQTLLASSAIKSEPSIAQTFELRKNWVVSFLNSIDVPTTVATVIIAVSGLLLLRRRKIGIVQK